MKPSFLTRAPRWSPYLLAMLLAVTRPGQAGQGPPPAAGQAALVAATTHPVQAPVHGHLSDVFFSAGERVKRGQILAKLTRPDGSPAYLLAPAAGRIGPARQRLGEHLAAHATLAVIETSTVPSRN